MIVREVTYTAIVIRILAAFALGGIIGMERGMKNRPAGLRTYMLVCVGSCLIMLTNQYIYQVFGSGDPVRMGAQVVSGIGFLGAGTIVVTKRNRIRGLTTAAGLWPPPLWVWPSALVFTRPRCWAATPSIWFSRSCTVGMTGCTAIPGS